MNAKSCEIHNCTRDGELTVLHRRVCFVHFLQVRALSAGQRVRRVFVAA